MSAPLPFPGTAAEIAVNKATHHFGDEGRCWDCDCRPWGRVAEWPCGTDVPRDESGDEGYFLAGFVAHVAANELT